VSKTLWAVPWQLKLDSLFNKVFANTFVNLRLTDVKFKPKISGFQNASLN
jgi:hypothetical protein